jgi:hypothetical protein
MCCSKSYCKTHRFEVYFIESFSCRPVGIIDYDINWKDDLGSFGKDVEVLIAYLR